MANTINGAIDTISSRHRHLWFLTLAYSMVIVTANWFDPRLITIFNLDTDAGTIIFPLTYLLSDVITEVYGYKLARRAIWCGFLFNLLFIFYGQIITHMPSPSYAVHNAKFDSLFSTNVRIIAASAISYFSSEPLNCFLMAKLKIKTLGKYMGIRFVLSTVLAAGVDSMSFSVLAFYGTISNHNLVRLALMMWFIKVIIEIAMLPISIRLAKKLKRIERLDIYDDATEFSIFKSDIDYNEADNLYDVHKDEKTPT